MRFIQPEMTGCLAALHGLGFRPNWELPKSFFFDKIVSESTAPLKLLYLCHG